MEQGNGKIQRGPPPLLAQSSSVRTEESRPPEVVCHDNGPCGIQHEFHVVCVGCTCHMYEGIVELIIDETVLELLYEVQDPMVKVLGGSSVIPKGTLIGDVTVHDLLCKYILLVQEEHNGCVGKGPVVAHGPEELKSLNHAVCPLGLSQGLIILGESCHKYDGINVIKAVDPLAALRPLTPNVIHLKVYTVNPVPLHNDLGGADARKQYVLGSGLVISRSDSGQVIEVLLMGINDIHCGPLGPDILHRVALPEGPYGFDMTEELLRIIVGSETRTRTLSHPVLRAAVQHGRVILGGGSGVVDQTGDELVVRSLGAHARGVLFGVLDRRALRSSLVLQRRLESQVAEMGAQLPHRHYDVAPHHDTVHSQVVVAPGTAV
mmetsp:Transcript_12883/g.26679  ORF Transcript_12883/g.26679 Transcript_12883/m.26679 type:complete len:377 (+) Transcript_12883:250-1380(+)